MDRINKIKQGLRKYFADWIDYHPDEQTGVPLRLLEDSNSGDFILVEHGFIGEDWCYNVFVHLNVKSENEIIVLRNQTDIPIDEELKEYGLTDISFTSGWFSPIIQDFLDKQAA